MSDNNVSINVERIDDHMNFRAINSEGKEILMDASPSIGGKNNGVRPMETLLMGLAGCSGIDVVLILKKMKQEIADLKIQVTADRVKVADVTEFKDIKVHFQLWGDLKENKVQKAIDMSLEKYCSVAKILERSATISSSYTLMD